MLLKKRDSWRVVHDYRQLNKSHSELIMKSTLKGLLLQWTRFRKFCSNSSKFSKNYLSCFNGLSYTSVQAQTPDNNDAVSLFLTLDDTKIPSSVPNLVFLCFRLTIYQCITSY
ncbi:hypothetical protein ACTFIW_005468 [Dictyostelium discoideum]